MSRSQRAWMESCTPASVGERTGLEEAASLERGTLLKAVSFTQRLIKFLVAGMLLIALAPASSLAKTQSSHAKSPTTQTKSQPASTRTRVVVLARGSGYVTHGSTAVRALQRRLARAGDSPGPLDGRYGPLTQHAVSEYQAAHGLVVDGIAGPLTLAALSRPSLISLYPGAGYVGRGSAAVRALQRRLARAGDSPGPIDGRYGPVTEQAVTRFQAAHGLRGDGIAGPRTMADLDRQRPASHQPVRTRRTHPATSRPQTPNRPPTPAPPTTTTVAVSHPTSSPQSAVWTGLAVLAVAIALCAALLGRRRRQKRDRDLPVTATNGAARSNAVGTQPSTTPASQPDTPVPTPGAGAPDTADRAFRHAFMLEEQGDQMGAMAAYQQADRLGHAAAASNLGVLLEEHGDPAAAMIWYRRADQRGDPNGAFNLGALLEEQGELTAAAAAYRRADRLGHGAAASNLGLLLEQTGDQPGAEACYRRADQRGDGSGAFNLAGVLEEHDDPIGALRAYQRATALGHDEIAEKARAAAIDLRSQVQRPSAAVTGGGHRGS